MAETDHETADQIDHETSNLDTRTWQEKEPEAAQLMNFIAEKAKNFKSLVNISHLCREFKEKSGSAFAINMLDRRIRNYRSKIHELEGFDMDTKIKAMFALRAQIDADFLEKLREEADVVVNENNEIVRYEKKTGGLILNIENFVPRREPEKDDEMLKFLAEKSKTATSPINDSALAREYQELIGAEHLEAARLKAIKKQIYMSTEYDKATRIRMLYISSATVHDDFLNELQEDAIVEFDDEQRIIHYKANDGSLELGEPSKDHVSKISRKRVHIVENGEEEEESDNEEDDEIVDVVKTKSGRVSKKPANFINLLLSSPKKRTISTPRKRGKSMKNVVSKAKSAPRDSKDSEDSEDVDDSEDVKNLSTQSLNDSVWLQNNRELIEFIAEKATSEKMSVRELSKEFAEKTEIENTVCGWENRIRRIRNKIDRLEGGFDMETMVKLMFALSAPVEKDFLKKMRKEAHVKVDDRNRIIKYEKKGGLKLGSDAETDDDGVFETPAPTPKKRGRPSLAPSNSTRQGSQRKIKDLEIPSPPKRPPTRRSSKKRESIDGPHTPTICNSSAVIAESPEDFEIDVVGFSDDEDVVADGTPSQPSECIRNNMELIKFIAANATGDKLSIQQLSKDFKEISGTELTFQALACRIRRFRGKIHELTDFDTETIIKLLIALDAPTNSTFLKKLSKEFHVEVDNTQRIVKYEKIMRRSVETKVRFDDRDPAEMTSPPRHQDLSLVQQQEPIINNYQTYQPPQLMEYPSASSSTSSMIHIPNYNTLPIDFPTDALGNPVTTRKRGTPPTSSLLSVSGSLKDVISDPWNRPMLLQQQAASRKPELNIPPTNWAQQLIHDSSTSDQDDVIFDGPQDPPRWIKVETPPIIRSGFVPYNTPAYTSSNYPIVPMNNSSPFAHPHPPPSQILTELISAKEVLKILLNIVSSLDTVMLFELQEKIKHKMQQFGDYDQQIPSDGILHVLDVGLLLLTTGATMWPQQEETKRLREFLLVFGSALFPLASPVFNGFKQTIKEKIAELDGQDKRIPIKSVQLVLETLYVSVTC